MRRNLLRIAKYSDHKRCSGGIRPPVFRRSESAATEKTRHYILRGSIIRSTTLVIAMSLFVSLPGVVSSARAAQQGGANFGLEGKITRQAPGKLTVSSQDNMIFHVSYDQQTKIYRKDGSAGSAGDLKVGAQIRVDGSLNPQGVVEARRINLE